MRGQVPAPTGLEARPFYGQPRRELRRLSAFGLAVGDEWRARNGANGCPQNWVPLAQRCNVVAGTPFLRSEINPINEKTKSAYGMLRFKHDFENDVRVTGNVGLRYTKTTRDASGFLAFPNANQHDADCAAASTAATTPPTDFCRLTPGGPPARRGTSPTALNPPRRTPSSTTGCPAST
jgi:outer membrane receptor protein involved in Fe transport